MRTGSVNSSLPALKCGLALLLLPPQRWLHVSPGELNPVHHSRGLFGLFNSPQQRRPGLKAATFHPRGGCSPKAGALILACRRIIRRPPKALGERSITHQPTLFTRRFYDLIHDPLEGKREICELNPDCDELADHIGFQEAYRRYYGPI
uniref:Osteocalcin n=1 Tax=Terrapene triunguis TaxID=2587831 RepID=A0A674K5Q7_9SAUR